MTGSEKQRVPNVSENISGKSKTTSWDVKMEQRQRMQAVKQREREMKQAREDEAQRKRDVRRERVRKAEEKARLEAMAARVCGPQWLVGGPWRWTDRCADEPQEGTAPGSPDGPYQEGCALSILISVCLPLAALTMSLTRSLCITSARWTTPSGASRISSTV